MELPDAELMERLSGGDETALNRLMERWSGRVFGFLHRSTGDREAALDLAQETFVKLYQARHRYRPKAQFSTYLFTIAANLARNHARWRARQRTTSLDAAEEALFPDPAHTPEERAQLDEEVEAVERAFRALPAGLREAMTLFIHEEMSYSAIAAVLGCTPKGVETRIYRARQILRAELSKKTSRV